MDIKRVLRVLWFTPGRRGRWGLPVCWWGGPGVGKTTVIEHAAKEFGFGHVETLSPGSRGEGAFGVVPMPTADGSRLLYPPPDWVEHFRDGARGIVFVDEINRAAPAIQPPLLGLVNELQIGSSYLGGHVRVVAAANPVETAPGVYEMDPAEANRMGHLDWPTPSAEEWGAWAISGCNGSGDAAPLSAAAEEARVMVAWPEALAVATGRVTAFLRSFPDLLCRQPPEGNPARGRAWPSPRSWELGLRALAGASIHRLDESDTDELLAGFVGAPAAQQYATWLSAARLPDPIAVLDGREPFEHDPDRLDRTAAVLGACAAMVVPPQAEQRDRRAIRLWIIMGGVAQSAVDIVEPAAVALVKAGLGETIREARPVLARMAPTLKMAHA